MSEVVNPYETPETISQEEIIVEGHDITYFPSEWKQDLQLLIQVLGEKKEAIHGLFAFFKKTRFNISNIAGLSDQRNISKLPSKYPEMNFFSALQREEVASLKRYRNIGFVCILIVNIVGAVGVHRNKEELVSVISGEILIALLFTGELLSEWKKFKRNEKIFLECIDRKKERSKTNNSEASVERE